MKTHQNEIASKILVTSALLMLAFGGHNGLAKAENQNPGIVPLEARYGGHTYGEWLALEEQWALGLPVPENPNFGIGGSLANGQPQELWFLPIELLSGAAATFNVTVPAGKALYLILEATEFDNFLCVFPPTAFTADQLRQQAISAGIDGVTVLEADVDGVPVTDPKKFAVVSPVFNITLPDNNVFEVVFGCPNPAGTYSPAVAAGYCLLFTPLPVGQHKIHEHVTVPSFGVDSDLTYVVTVVPDGLRQ